MEEEIHTSNLNVVSFIYIDIRYILLYYICLLYIYNITCFYLPVTTKTLSLYTAISRLSGNIIEEYCTTLASFYIILYSLQLLTADTEY